MRTGVRPLVGRRVEQTALKDAMDAARSGHGRTLLVVGSAGIGKTTLLSWALDAATDFRVLRARGGARAVSDPYSVIRSLLSPVFALPPEQFASERAAVDAVLTGSSAPTERFALGLALVTLFAALADATPLLVAVDDLQWADPSSLDALHTVRDRLGDDAVLFLFAERQTEPTVPHSESTSVVVLGELTVDESYALVSTWLAPEVARRVVDAGRGNPLVLHAIADGLDAEQRAGSAPVEEQLFQGPVAERAFLDRVEELEPVARSLLQLASADGAIERRLLADVAEEMGAQTAMLERLVTDEFLVPDDGGRLVFTHPLLRVALYRSMSDPGRAASHRAIATRLPDEQLHRRAWHLASAASGFDPAAADLLEQSAASAREHGGYAVAADTFARSAALTADTEDATRRLSAAGDAYFLAGDMERASSTLEHALSTAVNQSQRADIQLIRARVSLVRPEGGVYEELVAEAEATEAVDAARGAMLFATATFAALSDFQVGSARHASDRAMALVPEDDPAHQLAVFGRAGTDLVAGDHAIASPVYSAIAEMLEQVGPSAEAGAVPAYLCAAFTWIGEFDQCARLSGPQIEYERSIGALGMLSLSLAGHALYLFRTGDWLAARAIAGEAIALARESNQYFQLSHALTTSLVLAAATGRFEQARTLANEVMPLVERPGMRMFEMQAFGGLGFLEVTTGNFATAKALLLRAQEIGAIGGVRHPTLVMWQPDLVESAVALGDRRLAAEVSAQLTADARHNALPYGLALAARCRGILADDGTSARCEFESALGFHARVSDPFQQARTQLCFGERLVADGHADNAVEPLRQALVMFDRLGATPWSERVRRSLPGSDAQSTGVPPSPLSQLTARELQVALLVVDGKPSREVAAELFLSRRTVEHHLAVIYRKLGITNRTQLARELR